MSKIEYVRYDQVSEDGFSQPCRMTTVTPARLLYEPLELSTVS